jgi:uncharacterized membrane protein YfcA
MTAHRLVYVLLAWFAINGIFAGYSVLHQLPPSRLLSFLFPIFLVVVTYLWYYNDAKEQKYRRTTSLGSAIILFTFFSVAYYLYCSRPPGMKYKAVLRYLGFCFLCFVVMVAAAIPFLILTLVTRSTGSL